MSVPQGIPAIFGHRGACGYRPENTLESFALAFAMGVNAVECDIVPTKDGKLVILHDPEMSGTTNVAQLPEFAHLRRDLELPWRTMTGWFVHDFTADEVGRLRAKERLPEVRPGSAKFDGQFAVPTLKEFLHADFATAGRTLILEVKFGWLFKTAGLDIGPLLAEILIADDWRERGLNLVIESFDYEVLLDLRNRLADEAALGGLTFVLLTEQWRVDKFLEAETSAEFLMRCAADFDGISFDHAMLSQPVPDGSSAQFGEPTGWVEAAHEFGLVVYTWTARAEDAHFSIEEYFQHFVDLGVDGVFADQPDLFVNFLTERGLAG